MQLPGCHEQLLACPWVRPSNVGANSGGIWLPLQGLFGWISEWWVFTHTHEDTMCMATSSLHHGCHVSIYALEGGAAWAHLPARWQAHIDAAATMLCVVPTSITHALQPGSCHCWWNNQSGCRSEIGPCCHQLSVSQECGVAFHIQGWRTELGPVGAIICLARGRELEESE